MEQYIVKHKVTPQNQAIVDDIIKKCKTYQKPKGHYFSHQGKELTISIATHYITRARMVGDEIYMEVLFMKTSMGGKIEMKFVRSELESCLEKHGHHFEDK